MSDINSLERKEQRTSASRLLELPIGRVRSSLQLKWIKYHLVHRRGQLYLPFNDQMGEEEEAKEMI